MSWGASNNGQNFGIHTDSNVTNTTSGAQLFTVVAGSYALPGSFGSGAAVITTADAAQDQNNSALVIRKQDTQIDFAAKIVLNITEVDVFPGATTGQEVRFSAKNTGFPTPVRMPQSKNLPPNDLDTFQPLFADVEVLRVDGLPLTAVFPASASGLGQLKARFLHGGQLALVNVDYNLANDVSTTPVLASDFNILNAGEFEPFSLVLSIRGSYLCDSPYPY